MSPTVGIFPLLITYPVKQLYYYRFKQFEKWPQFKSSLLWGHLGHVGEAVKVGPPDRHIDFVFEEMRRKLGNPPAFIFDLRPANKLLCIVASHEIADLPKTPVEREFVPFLGHRPILTMQETEWKQLRQRFNPAFSKSHVMTLMPFIMGQVSMFIDTLDSEVRRRRDCSFQDTCGDLTLGVVGANNDDPTEMGEQKEIVQSFRDLHSSYAFDPNVPPIFTDPRARWHRNRMEKKLAKLVKDRTREVFARMKKDHEKHSTTQRKSILVLTLQTTDYFTPDIEEWVCDQFKLFMFAGFDTTSLLLAWLFYRLSLTAHALKAIRDDVMTSLARIPTCQLPKRRSSSPVETLGRMFYTSVVIKETLRLNPPAATSRTIPNGSNAFLRMPDVRDLFIDDLSVYNCHTILHRDDAIYGETKDDFIPERWLPSNGDTKLGSEEVWL
ncbi:hypothetical protein MW887_003578 [Aspergillus wentii]|nr:hypothetical protein MW887_003578 [Aspergillus wentii]